MKETKSLDFSNETFDRLNELIKNYLFIFKHPNAIKVGYGYTIFKLKDTFYKFDLSWPENEEIGGFILTLFPNILLDSNYRVIDRANQMIYQIYGYSSNGVYVAEEMGKKAMDWDIEFDFYFRKEIEENGMHIVRDFEEMLQKIQKSLE